MGRIGDTRPSSPAEQVYSFSREVHPVIGRAIYPYQDSVVLVTGAGTGIGRSIARAFLEQGAKVAAVGRTRSALEEATGGFSPEQVLVLSLIHI